MPLMSKDFHRSKAGILARCQVSGCATCGLDSSLFYRACGDATQEMYAHFLKGNALAKSGSIKQAQAHAPCF